ncbi:MAG: hypothetical protein AAF225_10135 [Pseudomonadota bacterium]
MSEVRLIAKERGYHDGRIIEAGEEFIFRPTVFGGDTGAAAARTKAAAELRPGWADPVEAPNTAPKAASRAPKSDKGSEAAKG